MTARALLTYRENVVLRDVFAKFREIFNGQCKFSVEKYMVSSSMWNAIWNSGIPEKAEHRRMSTSIETVGELYDKNAPEGTRRTELTLNSAAALMSLFLRTFPFSVRG